MGDLTPPRPVVGVRIAVLASGGGSNLEAILRQEDTIGAGRGGTVVLVASDRARAGALDRARSRSVAAVHIPDPANAGVVGALLEEHAIDLIVLAGYLRLVPPEVTRRHRGRMINVHPALLPAFGGPGMYGIRAHRAVLASGARLSGVSVHFVDEAYDRGALIAQWPVPVLDGDTPESLAARVLRIEHLLYPRVVDAVARGAIALDASGHVLRRRIAAHGEPMFTLTGDQADAVAHSIDRMLA